MARARTAGGGQHAGRDGGHSYASLRLVLLHLRQTRRRGYCSVLAPSRIARCASIESSPAAAPGGAGRHAA
eukprot:COSAG03_NODE_14994_length_444_cov_1.171014_1_plen_70_part_01